VLAGTGARHSFNSASSTRLCKPASDCGHAQSAHVCQPHTYDQAVLQGRHCFTCSRTRLAKMRARCPGRWHSNTDHCRSVGDRLRSSCCGCAAPERLELTWASRSKRDEHESPARASTADLGGHNGDALAARRPCRQRDDAVVVPRDGADVYKCRACRSAGPPLRPAAAACCTAGSCVAGAAACLTWQQGRCRLSMQQCDTFTTMGVSAVFYKLS